ncbi:U-box domain-containing protein 16-like [Phalaenopsis equestris]|uniref:U-box domain-containing protein 16-like n=1 Tax=Phalaenopsis equestris TaxID=78828 RepID=UPI0009E388BF|nr:U-box domain-containing protein 16-like [Phalaenopsis equestris]
MAEITAASSSSSVVPCSFFSPALTSETPSDMDLIRSLLRLSHEISLFDAPCPILMRHHSSIARKSRLLAILFDELLLQQDPYTDVIKLPRSASLCFHEIFVVLQRFKSLLTECSSRSRMRFILLCDSLANDFYELTLDLSTLLSMLPISDLRLSDDVRDHVDLLRCQCSRSTPTVDPDVSALRREILAIIHEIELEIVPDRSRLAAILHNLGLNDSSSCRREIECLEREIGERVSDKWTPAMISFVGVVQYAKCVLYGASTPRSDSRTGKLYFAGFDSGSSPAGGAPPDFRCPISLDLMHDPVVVSSGQTFDRESIARWISAGHITCPSTGQTLRHTNLIPNRALKNLISLWCREQNVPYALYGPGEPAVSGGSENKAALEAARMTAAFLVQKLSSSPSTETTIRIVHELRQLAKTQSENRAFIAEAGAVPLLLRFLCSNDPSLQLNAVTTLLNLSILESNKRRIMRADGSLDAVIHVMSNDGTWQAKENAATLLLSLTSIHSYRRRIGENHSAVAELVKLVRNGPVSTKIDAMVAILSLARDRKNAPLLVEEGVLEAVLDAFAFEEAAESATAVITALLKRGGALAVEKLESKDTAAKLVGVLRRGTDGARDNAAAALVVLCRHSGGGVVAEVVRRPGIEMVIREMMGCGTERGRRKAAALGRICRRWVAGSQQGPLQRDIELADGGAGLEDI